MAHGVYTRKHLLSGRCRRVQATIDRAVMLASGYARSSITATHCMWEPLIFDPHKFDLP